MRLSVTLPALLAFGAIAKTHVPAVHLMDRGLTRRQFLEGQVCRFFEQTSLLLNDSLLYIDYAFMTMLADNDVPSPTGYLVRPFYYHLSKPEENLETLSTGSQVGNLETVTREGNRMFESGGIGGTGGTGSGVPGKTLKAPSILGGALYFSGQLKSKIVKYGGRYSNYPFSNSSGSVGNNEWWAQDTDSGEWATITPEGSKGLLRANGMASVNVPAQGLAFSIGGLVTHWTDSAYKEWNLTAGKMLALKSMLIYNTLKDEVKNVTISPLLAQWGGVVEYVQIGEKGVLVLIGGFESGETIVEMSGGRLKDMREINLYDIDTRKWHTQASRGSIPNRRAFACASVASAPDNSSHNIFVHGGTDGSTISYSDTYVLSLPSFEWIEVDQGFDTQSRLGHNCHMTTKQKMLVIGGRSESQEALVGLPWGRYVCDKYAVINVFDTNTMSWQDSWDPNDGSTKFQVNRVITAVIGGNESGGAIIRKPGQGWGSEAVQKLFEDSKPPAATQSVNTAQTTTPGADGDSSVNHAVRVKVGTVGLVSMAVIVAAVVVA